MSSQISKKTISYIIYLLRSELPEVFEKLPKNSKKYPDLRADYRRAILADSLNGMSYNFSQTLIDFIWKQDATSVRQLLYGLSIN